MVPAGVSDFPIAHRHPACRRRRLTLLSTLAVALVASGCGSDGPPRAPAAGNVTLDGQPLEWGAILFIPLPGTEGPKAAATIEAGAFRLSRDDGPVVGSHRIEIWSVVSPMRDIKQESPPESRDIPARYNRTSKLFVEVTGEGPNEFQFDLFSTPESGGADPPRR